MVVSITFLYPTTFLVFTFLCSPLFTSCKQVFSTLRESDHYQQQIQVCLFRILGRSRRKAALHQHLKINPSKELQLLGHVLIYGPLTGSRKPESCTHPWGQQESVGLISEKGDGKTLRTSKIEYTCLFLGLFFQLHY